MVFSKELITQAQRYISEVENLSDEDIPGLALAYVKENRAELIRTYLPNQENGQEAVFMAGSPGAGKTEFVKSSFQTRDNIIEADRVRKALPYYQGKKSSLFQRASSKAVNILLDYCFKHHLSFVLDGNFAILKNQQENISRSLKRGYNITILYVYRAPEQAMEFTRIREENEGRRISTMVFLEKSTGALETTASFIGQAGVHVHLIDMTGQEIVEDISLIEFEKRTAELRAYCRGEGVG